MRLIATSRFNRIAKKLSPPVKAALDSSIRVVVSEPEAGEMKVGDLAGIRVYKFKVKSQLYLFSYCVDAEKEELTLLFFATHENFYRDQKRG